MKNHITTCVLQSTNDRHHLVERHPARHHSQRRPALDFGLFPPVLHTRRSVGGYPLISFRDADFTDRRPIHRARDIDL